MSCTVYCTKDSRSWEWHVNKSPVQVFEALLFRLMDNAPTLTVERGAKIIQAHDPSGACVRWEVMPIDHSFTDLGVVLENSVHRVRFSKTGETGE